MRSFQPDTIIALGGGSPMDAAKIMWLFYEQPEVDFRDLVQKFMDIRKRAFKFPQLGRKSEICRHSNHLRKQALKSHRLQ
ncbi:Aldehyde-alcohol dehydrogenase [Mannheimia haemolytica]|uniref:Aldehyde-alcohol dehydrogenase n=1 Tax=Mannheimia haemolytica TaxID=75985 RepID=A0A378N7P7_MANHA|nr:Aldehyde-alcohol dehydrogenase [Mannheimia haemolytica]